MRTILVICLLALLAVGSLAQEASADLAATLEVLEEGVTVQRFNTSNPIAVRVEAIVGVGDTITTDATGRARITFFADGTSSELEPNTVYRIEEFTGSDETFILRVSVLIGQTTQQLKRALDAGSRYEIDTPGMTLAARGTTFAIRVEDTGRSAMLVQEGTVQAGAEENSTAVPQEFGVRSTEDGLSDVVRASTFSQLDSAIDGCSVNISTSDDVSLNVRVGPAVENEQIGYVSASEITLALGVSASGDWYRIAFEDQFGWVLSSSATVDPACAGLRLFEDTFSERAVSSSE
jgi:hypothetical protein